MTVLSLPINESAFADQFLRFADRLNTDDRDHPMLHYAKRTDIQLRHDPADIGVGLALSVRDYYSTTRHDGALHSWDDDPTLNYYHSHAELDDETTMCHTGLCPYWRMNSMQRIADNNVDAIRTNYADRLPTDDDPDAQRMMRASWILSKVSPLQHHHVLDRDSKSITTRVSFLWFDASFRVYDLQLYTPTAKLVDVQQRTYDVYPQHLHDIFPLHLLTYMPLIASKPMANYYDIPCVPIDL